MKILINDNHFFDFESLEEINTWKACEMAVRGADFVLPTGEAADDLAERMLDGYLDRLILGIRKEESL